MSAYRGGPITFVASKRKRFNTNSSNQKKIYGDEKEMDLHSMRICARRRRSP
jgi:CHAD domain-containing protein